MAERLACASPGCVTLLLGLLFGFPRFVPLSLDGLQLGLQIPKLLNGGNFSPSDTLRKYIRGARFCTQCKQRNRSDLDYGLALQLDIAEIIGNIYKLVSL